MQVNIQCITGVRIMFRCELDYMHCDMPLTSYLRRTSCKKIAPFSCCSIIYIWLDHMLSPMRGPTSAGAHLNQCLGLRTQDCLKFGPNRSSLWSYGNKILEIPHIFFFYFFKRAFDNKINFKETWIPISTFLMFSHPLSNLQIQKNCEYAEDWTEKDKITFINS